MTRKICASFLAAVLAVFSSFAAELVSDYTVDGTTYTRSGGWPVSDGATIIFKYANLPQTGAERLVSWSQSNKTQDGAVGLCSYSGALKGWWEDKYWAGGELNTTNLGSDGLVVCVYKPVSGSGNQGMLAYNASGDLIYKATGLKSTGATATFGTRFDISTYVTDIEIYKGEVAAEDIVEFVEEYNAKIPEGTLKYGYDFNGSSFTKEEAATSTLTAAKPATIVASQVNGVLQLGDDAGSHYGSNFSYGTGDWSIAVVAKAPNAGEVFYAMGGQRGATGLIGLRNAGDNTIEAFTANATKVTSITLESDPVDAYHLYTVVYSNGKLKVNVDGGEFTEGVDFTTGTAGQWQFGGIHGGFDKLTGVKNATVGLMDEFRVYSIALTKAQTYGLAKEFDIFGEKPTAEVSKNGALWRIDTTNAPYVFDASEINYLKANYTIVYLNSSSDYGATIDFGEMTGMQQAHFIFESGRHALKWKGNSASMNFGNAVDITNPCISVKNGAILDFYAKDVTGWQSSASNAAKNIFRVFDGGKVFLHKNGDNTFFFAGLWYLEPGAEIEADDFQDNKVCLSGGIDESHPQIHVISPTGESTSVTYRSNGGFRFPKDNPKGYGVQVNANSTLILDGDVSSVANDCHLGKFGDGVLEITGSMSGFLGQIKIAAGSVKVKASSGLAAERVVQFELDDTREIKVTEDGEWVIYTNEPKIEFDPDKDHLATTPVLRFSEIMPKPSDKPGSITTEAGYDKNGLESGWVELENTSETEWADLGDYKFCRANRGKVYTHADYGNFPSGTYIPPRGRFTFYTSERYSNSYPEAKDGNTSAFQHGTFDGKPIWYGDMLIWGDKVNPKKFPYVTLAYHPASESSDQILETVIIPSDTPEGYSIIVGHDEAEDVATQRWLCPAPTKNAPNGDTTNLTKIGPNVGSVYGTAKSVSEFAATTPATPGQPYTVSLNVNPVYNAAGTREADKITAVTLVYRTKLGKGASGRVPMTMSGKNDGGDIWTAEIPAEDIPTEPGQLIQWKTEITDAAENTWTSPSFMNKDDGYEWFGTITEPGKLNSEKLPTWHMFIDDESKAQMDVDADKQTLANNARVAIYDASSSTYYDYVRIDLRGNSSAHFNKKSHGLRFSKAHPLTMKDGVRGGEVKEIRKSSLIGEPADPSFMRQMIGFWLWDKMGNKVPFDFPVRCNLNGEFFQLGFHSERFTDELIEDVYGLDKYGYGYKNIGQMDSKLSTTAGGIEKKTPDDGNEKDYTVLRETLTNPMHDLGVDTPSNDNEGLTKFVVESFNLPAWLNYIASARITHEMDDVWANISGYYDDAQMLEGKRGTATWMPLGYDFNVSFGQYYHDGVNLQAQKVLMANQDWFKSHPFYGGEMVRCHSSESTIGTSKDLVNDGNRGIEAVLQSSKFRRLYLRRLRTLMDQELKAPGTSEAEVPFMVKMREMAELMKEDAVLDHDKYGKGKNGWNSSFGAIDSWGEANWPATISNGVDNIWEKYVVPRREHLYVTHSVTNTSKEVGYGETLNAGIPLAQSSLDALKEGLSVEAVDGGVVIRNANEETIDLSGWEVSGPVVMKLPAGTVIDQVIDGTAGELFVVTDRRAYIEAKTATLTDEVIIGNAKAGSGTDIGLTAADGTVVISADVILPPGTYTDVSYDVPVRLAPAGSFAFEGVAFNGGLVMGDGSFTLKNQNGYTNSASVVDAPTANIAFTGKGTFQLLGAKDSGTLMTVNDLYVSNGVFTVESKATTPETAAVYLNGSFAVEDKGTVNLKLTKNAAQGRGFFLAQKDKKCVIASSFNATLNGPGCRALQIDKGSVNLEIKTGAKIAVEATGADVRVFKGKGKIKVSGGKVDVSASGAASEIFSADKTVEISDGTLNLTSTDDCVNAATAITISGGTINGKSTSGDVFDSNGTMAITGGSIVGLAIGTESDGKSGQVFDVNEPNVVDFTDSTATIFAISGIDATLGAETASETISGKEVKVWTAPVIEGVKTVKLFMMIDGKIVTLAPESWAEVEVTESTTVEELVGTEQAATLAKFKEVTPEVIANWAKAHSSSTKPGQAIDLEAFALNCDTDKVDEAKKNFKVTITFGEDGTPVVETVEGVTLNIKPTIQGSADLETWHNKTDGDSFFKAVIQIGE